MSVTELRDFTASTVIVGRLNPLIFSPEWLQSNNVIGPQEGSEAREHGIEVMAPNIAAISIGSIKLIVEEARFSLHVSDEPLVRAKDFAAGCFRLLAHTPVFAVGLNFNATLQGTEIERWHRFGDTLAPKSPWGSFVSDEAGARKGGMRTLVMERQVDADRTRDFVRFSIQIAENSEMEAALQVNNHFHLGTPEQPKTGMEAYKLIEEIWDQAFADSRVRLEEIRGIANAA
ncbi:hypothetical protein C1T17_16355 [Sphingobium sp. SCG-1]|uniref:hypothetical protein n=1 Tax=Sphingobium sp. SCG-1 TaxID=2072936 RepID=UPI000CD69BFE|nr:hypothetical protein [Sphingobium sp. SCG-1]AUW59425.1 hypothetical protein C1T17_16355 [Sphingobium sp. SCG-1]